MTGPSNDDRLAILRRRLSRGFLAAALVLFGSLFLLGLDSRAAPTFKPGEPLPAFDHQVHPVKDHFGFRELRGMRQAHAA